MMHSDCWFECHDAAMPETFDGTASRTSNEPGLKRKNDSLAAPSACDQPTKRPALAGAPKRVLFASKSREIREKGNDLFKIATLDVNLTPTVRMAHFEQAAQHYTAAAAVPEASPEELASAFKNYSIAVREAAQLLQSDPVHSSDAAKLGRLLSNALLSVGHALAIGFSLHTEAKWCGVLDGVRDSVSQLCQSAFLATEHGGATKFAFSHAKVCLLYLIVLNR
jgi:hypothetical protein